MIVGSDSIIIVEGRNRKRKRKNDSNVGFVTAAFFFWIVGCWRDPRFVRLRFMLWMP